MVLGVPVCGMWHTSPDPKFEMKRGRVDWRGGGGFRGPFHFPGKK